MPKPNAMLAEKRSTKDSLPEAARQTAPRALRPGEPKTDSPVTQWKRDYCFGCGPANPVGLQLKFELAPDGDSYIAGFELGTQFGGPPGHAHGGIIATILDEAMNKANKLQSRVALTRKIEVEYLRPVPLGKPLLVEGRISSVRGRASYNRAEIRNPEGVVLARSRGKFLVVDAQKMFARELEKERREAERRRNSPTAAKDV